jgi:hypothetical protein
VTDGPYAETKELIAGLSVKPDEMEDEPEVESAALR